MRWLIRLSFVGAAYCGWQKQINGVSVQEKVMDAVCAVFGGTERFSGCSRTDAGVHALDYCASFSVDRSMEPQRLISALNAHLPADIAVFSAVPVSEAFHARYDVKQKTYHYRIRTALFRSPFDEGRVWHRPGAADLSALNAAAKPLVGTHDFTSFMAAGSKITDAVRTVYDASFFPEKDGVVFSVSADGFLYHMVRIMVGTLTANGTTPEKIAAVLEGKDRSLAGVTAPACGLYLARVEY